LNPAWPVATFAFGKFVKMIKHPLESASAQRAPGRVADHGTQEQKYQEE
jgi:hypothetical protein